LGLYSYAVPLAKSLTTPITPPIIILPTTSISVLAFNITSPFVFFPNSQEIFKSYEDLSIATTAGVVTSL